jgi:hypothetical protein
MASLKERNDQLEEEKKAQEAFREELEDGMCVQSKEKLFVLPIY